MTQHPGKREWPPDCLDIDSDAAASRSRRRRLWRSRSSAAEDGPSTLEEVLSSNAEAARRCLRYSCQSGKHVLRQNLETLARSGIVISTSYSGTKCLELSCKEIISCVQDEFRLDPCDRGKCVIWAACDKDPAAQRVLLAGPEHAKPMHVFSDVLDRLFLPDKERLLQIQAKYLSLWADHQLEKRSGGVTDRELSEISSRMGNDMLKEMSEILETSEFASHVTCLRHPDRIGGCPVSPRLSADPNIAKSFWMEGAGSTCTSWSVANQQAGGWMSESTLPFLVWLYSTRYMEPQMGLHECVKGFPESALKRVLGCPAEKCLKAPEALPLGDIDPADEASGYEVMSHVFSPCDLGIPVRRTRKYSSFHLRRFISGGTLEEVGFADMLFTNMRVAGSIYLVAPDKAQKVEFAEVRSKYVKKKAPRRVISDDAKSTDIMLEPGDYQRLEGWKLAAIHAGLCEVDQSQLSSDSASAGQWKVPLAVVNVSQSAARHDGRGICGIDTQMMPTLLPGSVLVDLCRERVIFAAEMWIMHGYPHPDFAQVSPSAARLFPCPELVQADQTCSKADHFNSAEQRRLVGNSMHWAQVGAWFLYNAACATRV